jgi:hypothetical protein
MTMNASARPERLHHLAETTTAIAEAVARRAGHLEDAHDAYVLANGGDWRIDFSALDEALLAWAETLAGIGAFVGQVGTAFEAAGSPGGDGIVSTAEYRMLALLPCDARIVAEQAWGAADVDWGDPEEPPEWVVELGTTSMVVGHLSEGADTLEVAFVAGSGANARWSPATPAVLGRFASAEAMQNFGIGLGLGVAGLSGVAAGLEQWVADRRTLTFTDGEVAVRAATRGVGTGVAALGGGLGGAAIAGSVCGPGVVVCSGAIIIGAGVLATAGGDRVLDRVLDQPGPAEHDPDLVEEAVAGYEPGDRPGDVADSTWDLIEAVETEGEAAGEANYDRRNAALFEHDISPETVHALEVPAPWVEREARFPPGWSRVRDVDGELVRL